ncbi:MAG: tetratricopeptide repeat protein [Treponema sp.]|nr:tetratricopeptide repeat protein [Treponema sp.]MCL2250927.1 tetratricopeptide repeat protein [Treponema sp.]
MASVQNDKEKENGSEKSSPLAEKIKEGVQFYRQKEWDKALKAFLSKDQSFFSSEEKMELAYYLGLCYTKLQKYEEALSFLEQVVTSSGDVLRIFQCRMTLAYIYVITKRVKMAEYELNRLKASGFESPILYNTLAYAAYIQNQNKNAIELYEKTLEIDSNNSTAMNSMGFILADTGKDVMRALRLCRKAVDKKPGSAAYLDSLGWAYFKSGETLEARTWLRRALDIAPNEEEIKKHFKIVTGESK